MDAFLIEFRSFRYIACYFWWLVQGVLVLNAVKVFFYRPLFWHAELIQHTETCSRLSPGFLFD